MIKKKILQFFISIIMLVSLIASIVLKPEHLMADDRNAVEIDKIIPKSFGNWISSDAVENQIVNPVQEATIKKIYAQTLSRVYKSNDQVIMLTIAYGKNQSDSTEVHRPDVCYPAQGFRVYAKRSDVLVTRYGKLKFERLMANNIQRLEPVTYWTVIGNKIVSGGLQTKLTKIEYGLKNKIPDGLLFRVSSVIDSESRKEKAYQLQDQFLIDLLSSMKKADRNWIMGFDIEH